MGIPDNKLRVVELPARIRELLEPYRLPLDFSELEDNPRIDVTSYFACE
jgi:hypothetical protein